MVRSRIMQRCSKGRNDADNLVLVTDVAIQANDNDWMFLRVLSPRIMEPRPNNAPLAKMRHNGWLAYIRLRYLVIKQFWRKLALISYVAQSFV
jgi:hypothetical protein